ncbi:hypothetical protein HNQ51_001355 [Inhella inkyongensis]|uniref:Uncharacterized protein n=1 Tax=Inhella inkyongensis TaxID=392593 RepID=A0A840S3E4_9BURK|nr:hypothetical protein [Inhella inkyongensis]MBB5204062.1 hypothetical protein [Inhella inkyongensis]
MKTPLTLLALMLSLGAVQASSTAASSASDSVGSLSNSVSKSSDSSTGTEVATGPYVLVRLQPLPEAPGQQRLVLRRLDADEATPTVALDLPESVVAAQALQAGQTLHVQNRAYGLALARWNAAGPAPEPFFLALQDPRELANRKL